MSIVPTDLSLEQAAVEYAEAGRVVFPLGGEDGKQPRVKWGSLAPGPQHVRQVRYWWRKWPQANIGLRTGDGVVVIDVDTRDGGEIDPTWPATLTSQTRSGGYHLFYRCDAAVRCSVKEVAVGVDVRGERGYVVAPPSPGWHWLNDLPIAALPPLSPNGSDTRQPGARSSTRRPPFEFQERVSKGGRNAYLASYAGWLYRQGYAEWDVREILQTYNECCCDPPVDEDKVDRIVASIGRYPR